MEDNTVIKVENATVRFNLSAEKVDNIKEYIVRLIKKQLMFQEFLALKDINFEVKKGESWGIVGNNGSGKSTLLKLICGIIKPYCGRVTVNGTIAPLIELGAGFDGEMTARENIFLNGALLGHSKGFMQEQFEKIVDFAELWDFIDTPVKNFSSGMSARLGFSIATMVEPEILIVDEILSVGDYAFQQKCEKRMEQILSSGTTLIFVSHSAEQVVKLCKKVIWLDKGQMIMQGEAEYVSNRYISAQENRV